MKTPIHAQMRLASTKRNKEQLAERIFNIESVEHAIHQRCLSGFGELRIFQDVPVDFSQTLSAQTLIAHLLKQGFETEWLDASEKETHKRRETGRNVLFRELLISWKEPQSNRVAPEATIACEKVDPN